MSISIPRLFLFPLRWYVSPVSMYNVSMSVTDACCVCTMADCAAGWLKCQRGIIITYHQLQWSQEKKIDWQRKRERERWERPSFSCSHTIKWLILEMLFYAWKQLASTDFCKDLCPSWKAWTIAKKKKRQNLLVVILFCAGNNESVYHW